MQLHVFMFLIWRCCSLLWFFFAIFDSSSSQSDCRDFRFYLLFVFIYTYWCPAQFPYQMWFSSNTTSPPIGVGPANPSGVPEFTPVFCWIRVAQSLALFCRSLFVRMSFFVFSIVLSDFPFTLTADLFDIFNVSY